MSRVKSQENDRSVSTGSHSLGNSKAPEPMSRDWTQEPPSQDSTMCKENMLGTFQICWLLQSPVPGRNPNCNGLRAVPRNYRCSNYKKSTNKKLKHIINTEESKSSAEKSNSVNPGPAQIMVHPFSQKVFIVFPCPWNGYNFETWGGEVTNLPSDSAELICPNTGSPKGQDCPQLSSSYVLG